MSLSLVNTITPTIFRAYDIRGTVEDQLTPNAVYTLGIAIGSEAQAKNENTVIIARDGRLSGSALLNALAKGLQSSGCNVIDIGAVPTPLLYFATHTLSARSGVMLTGSHNPPNYNGLKIVIAGETLADERIQGLYQRIKQHQFATGDGKYEQQNIIPAYIEHIAKDIQLKRPLKIVIDAGNGIAGSVAPQLFRQLGCDVIELFCEVDGHFPNHHPDPSVVENLQDLIKTVKEKQADIGLAFDGDADRLGVVTNQGDVIWPDRQLMLYAIDVLSRNSGATIIYDIKSTYHLETVIQQHKGKPLMWKTGHSLIKAKMRETGALLAGEMSGHTFFKERWYGFDDGLYTAARLLEILSADKRSAYEIFADIPDSVNTPELKVAIAEEEKFTFIEQFQQNAIFENAKISTIDGLRADFDDGWGLVRASNTTPYLILRFEAVDESSLKKVKRLFRHELLKLNKQLDLPF